MLCKYCSGFSLKLLRESGYIHHFSMENLLTSAEDGCGGCKIIQELFKNTNHYATPGPVRFLRRHEYTAAGLTEIVDDEVEVRWRDQSAKLWLAADDGL